MFEHIEKIDGYGFLTGTSGASRSCLRILSRAVLLLIGTAEASRFNSKMITRGCMVEARSRPKRKWFAQLRRREKKVPCSTARLSGRFRLAHPKNLPPPKWRAWAGRNAVQMSLIKQNLRRWIRREQVENSVGVPNE